jgi:DHA1 family bicyclomycin/chloramphenicol resistance-like MFS transporter
MRWTPRPARQLNAGLLTIIALLAALAPFATDIYLPAFPAMAAQLGTSATGAQVTMTAFLAGAGAGQLVFGPLSDRVGRRRPLIFGGAVCAAASLAAAFAPTLPVLVAARLVQGLSGAAGMVLGRAIIADVAKGRDAARAFNLTSIVLGIAPVAAPLIGAVFARSLGWRGLLGIVAGLSVVTWVCVVLFVPETRPAPAGAGRCPAGAGRSGLGSRGFVGNTLAMVFGFGAMMAYIAASPFVYQVMIGMSELVYGLVFGVTALAITAVSFVSARLAGRVPTHVLLRAGVGALVVSAVALGGFVASPVPSWWLVGPLFVGVSAMGLVFGNATALALAAVPGRVGTASALLGAAQFLLGAAVAPLVGVKGEHSATPMALAFGACAALAALAYLLARNSRRPAAGAEPGHVQVGDRPATAADLMKTDVYSLSPDETVARALRLFVDRGISGAPVVDREGRVVGFLSDGDVMRFLADRAPVFASAWSFLAGAGDADFRHALSEIMALPVTALAARRVIAVKADDDVEALCKTLTDHHLRKVPVCFGDRLVGVVNRSNITRHAVETYLAHGTAAGS